MVSVLSAQPHWESQDLVTCGLRETFRLRQQMLDLGKPETHSLFENKLIDEDCS
jgi:hypothetical protein